MNANPVIIGGAQRQALAALREKAIASPFDVKAILDLMKTPEGMIEHMKRMGTFSIPLPVAFVVTFTIETGHRVGSVRHMSMSSDRRGRAPTPEAVWMVAEALGFVGGINDCEVWLEEIGRNHKAVNVVQPLALQEREGHA